MSLLSTQSNISFWTPVRGRPLFCASASSLPANNSAVDSLGVNVHFFTSKDGQPLTTEHLNMIQQAGFHRVRMDLLWSQVEQKPGVFDFSAYDKIIQGLLKRGIRPMIILGLGNPLYASGLTVQNPKAAVGFERYAKEVVKHYQGLGPIYELVNEPNHPLFWKPMPNVNEYMGMARELLPQLRALDSSAHFVAPSTAGAPRDYLERCFQKGLLNDVDGVTIHPYQTFYKTAPLKRPPEAFEPEMRMTRNLIDCYAPPGKHIPILLGEWGYSSIPNEVDEKTQANFLVRQSLLGMMYGSPVNIWYDWKGNVAGDYKSQEKEDNFGLVGVSSSLPPKPAYFAMQELSRVLKGKHYQKRLPSAENDYLLKFSDGKKSTLVSWTSTQSHQAIMNGQPIQLTGKPRFFEA
jgi:hypothetical protein